MSLTQLDEVLEELTLGFFMNGLNGVIRRKVRTHDSQTVTKEIHLARRVKNEIYGESMGFVSKNNSKGPIFRIVRGVGGGTILEQFKKTSFERENFMKIPQSIGVLTKAKIHNPIIFKMTTIHLFLVQALQLAMQEIHNLGIGGHDTYLTKSMSRGEKRDIVFNVDNNLCHSTSVSKEN
ncbi:hypothetical protein CR513_30278, partial [Mucuna pruriens]